MALTRRDILDLLSRHDIRPSQARGQNFVTDPNTVRRVARLAEVGPGDHVVEVGAGLGSLTLALADTGASVTALEVDRRLLAALREVVSDLPEITVVEGDAMKMNWTTLLSGAAEWVLAANLPYNIATPLVATLLDEVPIIKRFTVMVQREVAERLAATPGSPAYGAVSVKVAYWASASVVARVPPTVFWPQPKVESAVVVIRRRPVDELIPVDRGWLFRLVSLGFGQRRKMLRRSLAPLIEPSAFEAAGVSPEARPEELDVQDWARLAECTSPPATGPPASGTERQPS